MEWASGRGKNLNFESLSSAMESSDALSNVTLYSRSPRRITQIKACLLTASKVNHTAFNCQKNKGALADQTIAPVK
jgi:hypothetical protein